jgi:hypothetical protein
MGQVKRGIVGVALILGLVGALGVASGAGAAAGWTPQASTNRGDDSNVLNDVSCPTAAFCVAVGFYRDFQMPPTKPQGTLVETYRNGKWSTTASPGQGGISRLNGVSCPTTTRCYAVGRSHTSMGPMIVTSSGGGWSSVAPPVGADPGELHDIDCADETHCVAVGTRGPIGTGPLVLMLDGSTWTVVSVPSVGEALLYGVSCASTSSCVAVGYRVAASGQPRSLAFHLANGSWSQVAVPNRTTKDNRLYDVSCTAASRCTAVGSYFSTAGTTRTLKAAWASGAWTLAPGSTPGTNFAVDCVVASICTTAGQLDRYAVVMQQVGSSGTATNFGVSSTFAGLDCVTKNVCVAVGETTSDPFRSRTFIVRSH